MTLDTSSHAITDHQVLLIIILELLFILIAIVAVLGLGLRRLYNLINQHILNAQVQPQIGQLNLPTAAAAADDDDDANSERSHRSLPSIDFDDTVSQTPSAALAHVGGHLPSNSGVADKSSDAHELEHAATAA